jgi:peptide/nickel transport system substrate-binding protein
MSTSFGGICMKVSVVGVAALLSLVGVACGGDDSEGTATSAPLSEGPSADECTGGGTVHVGTFTEVRGLDPMVTPGGGTSGGTELAAIYETLMRFDPETATHEPRLAESLTSDEALTTWTLSLRPGVTFSDGSPLDAEAVRFTLERTKAPESRSTLRNVAALIESIEVVDELTVVFHLSAPWGGFASLLAGAGGMVVNPAAVTAVGDDLYSQQAAGGGAGPFVVERYAPGEELVLTVREGYWGGDVCLDSVVFTNVASAGGTYEAFTNGDFDVAVLRNSQTIAEARDDGVPMLTTLVNAGRYWQMNNGARGSQPPTADVRVREAFAAAIDPEVINTSMVSGTGAISTALIHPDSALYSGAEGPVFDRALATQLVEEVKADGWDGKITLTCTATPEGNDLAISTEALLEAAGFDVEVELLDRNVAVEKVTINANYDAFCSSLNIYDTEPWSVLVRQLTGGELPTSYVGYSNPDMAAALDELRSAPDLEARRAAMTEIQRIWNETMPGYTSFAIEEAVLHDEGVTGLQLNQESIVFLDRASIATG